MNATSGLTNLIAQLRHEASRLNQPALVELTNQCDAQVRHLQHTLDEQERQLDDATQSAFRSSRLVRAGIAEGKVAQFRRAAS
jgi:hypothetical protein